MIPVHVPLLPARILLKTRTISVAAPRSSTLLGCLLLLPLLLATGSTRALTVTAATSDNGYPAHLVQWTDAAGQPRSAVLVDQNSTGSGPYTGYLRRYTYVVNGQTRTCTGTQNYALGQVLEFSGDGFVQNHTADGGDFSSGNGAGVPGTTAITLQGSSHAIITFDMPSYVISGQNVPTTVQWFFADGRDHPVFSVCQDARATTGNLGSDSRTPYGDMAYDGDGVDALVGGFSYGDTFKFYTTAANPEVVTSRSGWLDIRSNTIPYTMQWANPATVNAEMGHVATVPISVSDQGQDTQTSIYDDPPDLFDPREQQMLGGPLPAYNTYAYQIINYSLDTKGDPTDSKRLAWGSNFGRVGGFDNYGDSSLNPTRYSQHSTDPINQPLAGVRADGMLMAYSTFIVLGTHDGSYASGAVGNAVADMETAAAASFTATVGTVVTRGPAGVGNAASTSLSYIPAGYNATYAAWEVTASQNTVVTTLAPANGASLRQTLFIVDGYTSSEMPTISIETASQTPVGYYATLDAAKQRLWITPQSPLSSSTTLQVTAPAQPPAHPAFFTGEQSVGNGTYYLEFPAVGQYFGYYGYLSDPNYIYHQDLGYEYVFDANDGNSGVYFFDFSSSTFFYTSPVFPFPYLYDFSLNTVLYYYPDASNPGHYNTDGTRYFYRFDTGQIIVK